MGTHPAHRKDSTSRIGLGLPVATAALLGASLLLILPIAFYAPSGTAPEEKLADMARVLPATVTWCLTGIVLVVSMMLAAYVSLVAISSALRDRPRARRAFLALFSISATAYFLYDVYVRDADGGALQSFYALLGPRQGGSIAVYDGARIMGAMGASISMLILGAAWALSAWTSGLGVAELRSRGRTHATLLSLASVGLASGAIATSARLQLQIDPGLSAEALEWAQKVAGAATVGYGGFFTLLLLAVFLPTAWVLRQAGERLACTTLPSGSIEDRQKWLDDQGLATTVPARLISALVALAPLLSSALSSTVAKAFTAVGT